MKIYSNKKIYFLKESLPDFCEIMFNDYFSKLFLINNKINAIFIRSNEKITNELLKGTSVEFIATATSGTDHIESGIPHYSAPGSNANSVAEYVIFSICKYLDITNKKTINSKIGIIGFGNIGKLVAHYSHLLGIEVLVNDPPLKDQKFDFPKYVQYADLVEIFGSCDIITNHVPLNKFGNYPTQNLIDRNLLELMQPNSLFIHSSRGGIVNQSDLKELLNNKTIFLAIDVWDNEPLFDVEIARKAMLATPHIAGYSYDGKIKASIQVLEHFRNHFGIEVNFSLLQNELLDETKKSISHFNNTNEIMNTLDYFRGFSNDNIDFTNFNANNEEEIKSYFIEFRSNYPNRREVLHIPKQFLK